MVVLALVAYAGCGASTRDGGFAVAPAMAQGEGSSPSPSPSPTPSPSPAPSASPAPTSAPRPASSANDPVLRAGDAGDAVRILQDLLTNARRRASLGAVRADGAFGPATESAVKELQRSAALPETGVVDVGTWSAIHRATVLDPLGAIAPAAAPLASDVYRRDRARPADVAIHLLAEQTTAPGVRARPICFESKMAIDADGAGSAWKSDPSGQSATSLRFADGKSLDPTLVAYFVLPLGFTSKHRDVKLGDLAAVVHGDKLCYAIFGDEGPRERIGEGSIALAKALGIDADPKRGGVDAGVFYVVFPGSGEGHGLAQSEIDRRAKPLFAAAGGNAR